MTPKSSVFPYLVFFLNKICVSNSFTIGNYSSLNGCKTPDLKRWIYFQYNMCVQLIINDVEYPPDCFKKFIDQLMNANDIAMYQKSPKFMKTRNILRENKTNCESFLLVMENPQHWVAEITQQLNKTQRMFYPFSRLYFLSLYGRELTFSNATKYLYENGVFGYSFLYDKDGRIVAIRDIIKNVTMRSSPNVTETSHPLLDTTDRNRDFAVSIFNCPPHFVYLNKNGTKMDGVEYRFLTHALKNWNIKFLRQNESAVPYNPFGGMFNDLAKGSSEMAMCGIWLHTSHYPVKDLTFYFDYNCNTWIAPKPKKVDPAELIYLSLSTPVWSLYAFCFILTAILLTIISKVEGSIQNAKIITTQFGRSLLEAANSATSHGVSNFPRQVSVQIILISWILLNILVGIGYTTVYTSQLTRPGHKKPIDTFEDFVDQGISWVTHHKYDIIRKTLNESTRPAFNNIFKNLLYVHTEKQLVDAMKTGRYGVLMSIRSHKYAVDIERIEDPDAAHIWNLFRFMKVCFYSHFSTFALRKHSPYTTLFNANIKKFQEFGIIKHWYADLYRGAHWMDTLFDSKLDHVEPVTLNLWNMSGAFFILMFGYLVASTSFLVEITYDKLMINQIN